MNQFFILPKNTQCSLTDTLMQCRIVRIYQHGHVSGKSTADKYIKNSVGCLMQIFVLCPRSFSDLCKNRVTLPDTDFKRSMFNEH